ncbi:amidophosphoribosyltransferase, partial [Entomortierella lignicola]
MCGITALILADPNLMASPELHEGLGMLQHRGQASYTFMQFFCSSLQFTNDAAGIVTCGNKGRLYQIKGNGMVREVFDQPKLEQLVGNMGVGH